MQKAMDPESVVALDRRVVRAFDEYTKIIEKLGSTSSQTNTKRLLAALVRKEIEFDEAMNDIAVIADGREDEDGGKEEDSKEQKDVSIRIACRVLAAFDEHNTVKEELESVTSGTLMKRLSKLLGHKETDFDEATNSVAVMAGKQRDVTRGPW
ncbi:hypothetical protein AAVH_07080 [Aphelenchoides avenae]|nr:hypothetical protein AAVH_07080 [Aphelenchus avenae]